MTQTLNLSILQDGVMKTRLHKMAFLTPMVRPLDESQGSSPLQGHGSWLMCEVALKPTLFITIIDFISLNV